MRPSPLCLSLGVSVGVCMCVCVRACVCDNGGRRRAIPSLSMRENAGVVVILSSSFAPFLREIILGLGPYWAKGTRTFPYLQYLKGDSNKLYLCLTKFAS